MSEKPKHTPGPWEIRHCESGLLAGTNFIAAGGKDENTVAIMAGENQEANANLLAVAPELLVLLENILSYVVYDVLDSCHGNKCRELWCAGCREDAEEQVEKARALRARAEAAIAKATGS